MDVFIIINCKKYQKSPRFNETHPQNTLSVTIFIDSLRIWDIFGSHMLFLYLAKNCDKMLSSERQRTPEAIVLFK